jgi:PAS domain S-box-containing protein
MWKQMRLVCICAVMGLIISYADFKTGPFFQFSYFFAIPVGIASWYGGRITGLTFAVLMPSLQSAYFLHAWIAEFGSTVLLVNLVMQILAFSAFAELLRRIASARRFRTHILECVPVGMWVLDRRGRLAHANPEGLEIWGGRPMEDQQSGGPSRIWRHGSDSPVAAQERPVVRALRHGDFTKNQVFDIQQPDGSRRTILGSAVPVLDEKGRIEGAVVVNQDITEAKRLEREREDLIHSLEEARKNIKILSGLLPICASCKKIRNDRGSWEQMEQYIRSHSEAEFSHGICPECMKRDYPEYAGLIGPQ